MAFLDKILGKKKNQLKARCPITKEAIETGYGFLLTTSQIIASKKYWDMVMTEPETLSYTLSHFKKHDESATQMRSLIFEKYSEVKKPWIISDTCINLFEDVDRSEAREEAVKWWESKGAYCPQNSGSAQDILDEKTFDSWKKYAIYNAGESRLQFM